MKRSESKKRRLSLANSSEDEENKVVDATDTGNVRVMSSASYQPEQPQPSTSTTLISADEQSDKSKSLSKLSDYFEYTTLGQAKVGKCRLCKNKFIKMKDSNTSGLRKHLSSVHKEAFKQTYSTSYKPNQSETITSLFKKIGEEKLNGCGPNFEKMIVEWMAKKYLPFNFFDDENTQTFFKFLNPKLSFPKKDAMRSLVIKTFKEMQTKVMNILQKCESKLSFTIDGWTSIACKSYYGITCHFIDGQWQLQSFTVDFVPSHGGHTGSDIAKIFFDVICEYNVQNKVHGITMDNAAANTTFIEKLGEMLTSNNVEFDTEQQHFRCFAHILNLGVQDVLKLLKCSISDDGADIEDENAIEDRSSTIGKLRCIILKVKHSEQLRNKLKNCCETTNLKYLSPSIDVCTRWNSTFDMIKLSLDMKVALNLLCENTDVLKSFKLNDGEWDLLKNVALFLRSFKMLSTMLCAEKYVTLPTVVVAFNILLDMVESTIQELDNKQERSEIDESLIIAFQAGRDKLLKHYRKTNWMYCVALILDPRHKYETFDQSKWGRNLKENSIKIFEDLFQNKYYVNPSPSLESDTISNVHNQIEDNPIDFMALYDNSESRLISWKNEIDEYVSCKRATKNENILEWWKNHENAFPNLAKMAKDFMAIPATSVPAERLFSRAGLTIRQHRNSLNDESARSLLCLNSWVNLKLT